METNKKNNKQTVLERPKNIDKFINTTFELCGNKNSQWIKDGTGEGTGRTAQHMHTSNVMFIPMRSRLFLGKGLGFMPTQYVIGARTIYVEDYFEDKKGNPIFDKLTEDQAKELGYKPKQGLRTIYGGEPGLEKEYRKASKKEICFTHGKLELAKFGNDPMLLKYINEHEYNKNAPNAAENDDPTRLKLFMFQPLIRENKAAKAPIVENFDASFDAMSLVATLRKKETNGSYTYNEQKMNAILTILEDGIGLRDGEVTQKFKIIATASRMDPDTFLELINAVMEDHKMEIGKSEALKVLTYSGTHARLTNGTKAENICTIENADDKEKVIDQLVMYFLGSDQGKANYREMVRLTEVAKLASLKTKEGE